MNADRTEKDQLIKELQERLDWYTFEASEEEFDAEEVEALVQLLGVMKGEETPPVEIPDFEELMESAVKKQEALTQETTIPVEEPTVLADDSAQNSVSEKKVSRFSMGRFSTVAAAILAVVLLAGGTMGVASAQKGQGFFHWLKWDETGEQIVISPNNDKEDVELRVPQVYEDENKVPEEYTKYLLGVENYDSLKEFELDFLEITEYNNCTEVLYQYKEVDEKQILISLFYYEQKIMFKDELYNDYIKIKESHIGNSDVTIFSRENEDGYIDYMFYYTGENTQYRISGNYPLEVLQKITEECASQ
ncbi:MAG: hypothetical protein II994_02365 [Lachnospiraceae bacterium]|nr:hypothetical protein [Lachnospiraceae bacterium]